MLSLIAAPGKAIELLEKAIELSPREARLHNELAEASQGLQ